MKQLRAIRDPKQILFLFLLLMILLQVPQTRRSGSPSMIQLTLRIYILLAFILSTLPAHPSRVVAAQMPGRSLTSSTRIAFLHPPNSWADPDDDDLALEKAVPSSLQGNLRVRHAASIQTDALNTQEDSPSMVEEKHPDVLHIAAVLDTTGTKHMYKEWEMRFKKTVEAENKSLRYEMQQKGLEPVSIAPLVLPDFDLGSSDLLVYVCDAIQHNNVASVVVIGNQDVINTVSIATRHSGIPLIGYNMDKKTQTLRGERPLYLQLDSAKALMATALVRILEHNNWFYASLIIEDVYATDGFLDAFLAGTVKKNSSLWRVEDDLRLSRSMTKQEVDYKLLNLLENQSRIIILHCSPRLAKTVFQMAEQSGFVQKYAWFVTEDVKQGTRYIQDYPVGLVSVHQATDSTGPGDLMVDTVRLTASALARYRTSVQTHQSHRRGFMGTSAGGCFSSSPGAYFKDGSLFYRFLKNTTVPTSYGQLSFNEDGVRENAHDFHVYNLVPEAKTGKKIWKQIGSLHNDSIEFNTIIWPGGTASGPTAKGYRILRVVTVITEPFVMEQPAVDDRCLTSVPCLRVETNNKEMLDDIFKDYENFVHNKTRPYNVSCCQGLSIMLVERLARDLNFQIQLYITNDEQYGYVDSNGTWNGMVDDLVQGSAHMALSAFSVTRARSRVIDFTYPYFYSGFSITVLEKPRSPPIYAFMEPFNKWVWISIVCSATVVAVALSLLEWNSPFGLNPWGRKRKTNYTLGSGLNMVYAILFQHTIKTKSPKAWPSKWLQNFWAGASIFIYSSYTANLAAFLAGKNSGVEISGVDDPRLLEHDQKIAILKGMAVEDFLKSLNPRLHQRARRYEPKELPIEAALMSLMNESIQAFIDDTSIVEYARTSMDYKCDLRMISRGFGEDAYAIGIQPRNSWLKAELTAKILEYHESGFTEDLKDLFFRRGSKCNYESSDGQLQGQAAPMNFSQHAGLYLLLVVGLFVCVLLMFVEHATFKYVVPYWRLKPTRSFWKSPSMMFWSQRLHRIITSEQLVSPHHSAREMMEVVKNRDFAKLFQKSVRKQEKIARNRKNLFNVVEQLKRKNRPDRDFSPEGPTVVADSGNLIEGGGGSRSESLNPGRTESRRASSSASIASQSKVRFRGASNVDIEKAISYHRPSNSEADVDEKWTEEEVWTPVRSGSFAKDTGTRCPLDTRLSLGAEGYAGANGSGLTVFSTDGNRCSDKKFSLENSLPMELMQDMPHSVDMHGDKPNERSRVLPNGSIGLFLSPNGDVLTDTSKQRRPPSLNIQSRLKGDTDSGDGGCRGSKLSTKSCTSRGRKQDPIERIKSLPLKISGSNVDSRVTPRLGTKGARRSDPSKRYSMGKMDSSPRDGGGFSDISGLGAEMKSISHLTKEELYKMWKASEKALNSQLKEALREKTELQRRLSSTERLSVT